MSSSNAEWYPVGVSPAPTHGLADIRNSLRVGGMTSDRPLPTRGTWLRVALPHPEELSEKDGQGWGVGTATRLGHQLHGFIAQLTLKGRR